MSTFVAHLRKEWRDQRAILLGIAAAIPLLLVAGLWLLGDTVTRVEVATPFIVAGAVALSMFALSTELFAGESRRNTQRFLRRLPLGLLRAWAAKVFFYLLALTTTAAYASLMFVCVAALFGGAERVAAVEAQLTEPGPTWLLTGGVVAVGLWILLVSTWIPKGGAAAGVALLLLGGLAIPVYLLLRDQPHFLLGWSALPGLAVAFVLTPLLLSAWCWCRGARFASGVLGPVLRGLPVVLLLGGSGLAYGAHAYDRWMDLDPNDPDCVFGSAYLGENERFVFVNAHRVDKYQKPIEGTERPWAIELATKEVRRLAPPGHSLTRPGWNSGMAHGRQLGGYKTLQILPYGQSIDTPVRWVDANDGTIWKTLPIDVQPPELIERLRDEARRHTPVRLEDGRRAWILTRFARSGNALRLDRRLERETVDGGVEGEDVPDSLGLSIASRFGWMARLGNDFVHVSGEAGSAAAPLRLARGVEPWQSHWLTSRTVLTPGKNVGRGVRMPWRIQNVETGAFTEVDGLEPKDAVLYARDASRVLVYGPGKGQDVGFAWCDTTTGTRSALERMPGASGASSHAYLVGAFSSGSIVVAGHDETGQGFCNRLDASGAWSTRLRADPSGIAPATNSPSGWAHGGHYLHTATDRIAIMGRGRGLSYGEWRTRSWEHLIGRP